MKKIIQVFREIYSDRDKAEMYYKKYCLVRTKRKHQIKSNITPAGYFYLMSFKCHYCDSPLEGHTGSSLDRKNSRRGYLVNNVVPCCYNCNRIKSNIFSYEQMMILSPALKLIKKKARKT